MEMEFGVLARALAPRTLHADRLAFFESLGPDPNHTVDLPTALGALSLYHSVSSPSTLSIHHPGPARPSRAPMFAPSPAIP